MMGICVHKFYCCCFRKEKFSGPHVTTLFGDIGRKAISASCSSVPSGRKMRLTDLPMRIPPTRFLHSHIFALSVLGKRRPKREPRYPGECTLCPVLCMRWVHKKILSCRGQCEGKNTGQVAVEIWEYDHNPCWWRGNTQISQFSCEEQHGLK